MHALLVGKLRMWIRSFTIWLEINLRISFDLSLQVCNQMMKEIWAFEIIDLHSNSTSDASQPPLRLTTPHRMLTLVAASTRWSATTALWLSRPCHAPSHHGFQMAMSSMMINHPILSANEAAIDDSPAAMSAFPPSDLPNTILNFYSSI